MSILGFPKIRDETVKRHAPTALAGARQPVASLFLIFLVAAFASNDAYGNDCPDSETAKRGLVLERPGVRTVVQQSVEQVAIVNHDFVSAFPQTQLLVGGLIEVLRSSSRGQFFALPASDFRAVFPLKEGQQQDLRWLWFDAKKNRIDPNALSLTVTGKETIQLGDCRYEVLAVRHVLTGGQEQVIDTWTALYSPDLQAVLAKRWDEGTAQENTVAFETIKALAE